MDKSIMLFLGITYAIGIFVGYKFFTIPKIRRLKRQYRSIFEELTNDTSFDNIINKLINYEKDYLKNGGDSYKFISCATQYLVKAIDFSPTTINEIIRLYPGVERRPNIKAVFIDALGIRKVEVQKLLKVEYASVKDDEFQFRKFMNKVQSYVFTKCDIMHFMLKEIAV